MESSMTPPAAGGAVPAELAPPVPDLTNGGPEVASDAAQTPAEQLGLIDGQIKAESSESGIDGGWSVHSVFESTNKKTGALETVVAISKPKLGPDGKQIVGEEGPEFDYKVYTPDKLLALQTPANPEAAEANEAEVAVEEMGEVAVKDEVEVVPQNRVTGADLIQQQIDSQDDWVEHRAEVPEVETPVEVAPRNRVEEAIQRQLDDRDNWVERTAPVERDVKDDKGGAEAAKTGDEGAEEQSEHNEDAAEISEHLEGAETSEVMNARFDAVTQRIEQLAHGADDLLDRIEHAPGIVSSRVEEFMGSTERGLANIGESVRAVKNVLRAVDMSFMYEISGEPHGQITSRDRENVVNLFQAVSTVVSRLEGVYADVERVGDDGVHAQARFIEGVGDVLRTIEHSTLEFASDDVRTVSSEIDGVGGELSGRAAAQAGEDAEVPEDERVNEADAMHMDKLSYIGQDLVRQSGYLIDDVERMTDSVTRKLGRDSQNIARQMLNAARLHPSTINEIITDLNSAKTTLRMAADMQGTRGSLISEIGFAVKQKIERAFTEIASFGNNPEAKNQDIQSDIDAAIRIVATAADTTSRFATKVHSLARESQR